MRLGVLDVGSNTVHLLVVDAHRGARPLAAYSHKGELRLANHIDEGNRLERAGADQLRAFVKEALQVQVLTGEDEERLTFLAARRWFGWSAGRLLVLDIGGGSLEIAAGPDEEPDVAVSLPLGANRLTRDWFTADPPPADEVRELRRHVRTAIARTVGDVVRHGHADYGVATSKTFRQLARIAGAAPSSEGLYVRRVLSHEKLIPWVDRLAAMSVEERVRLPGVSERRAAQLPAGALVADAAMDLFGLSELEICPWALREGIILRRLDVMPGEFQAFMHR